MLEPDWRSERTRALRFLAFYLPQYHPIPENDEWWGEGFTDWRNVAKARSLFRGHYQPHEPGELGYYDLRDPDVMCAQADLAREHGIDGFVFYHYWFTGRRLLERPVDTMVRLGRPDFPFCLCWANENWTRVWDGGAHQLLIEQHYSPEDDLAHIRNLLPVLADPRYITINGRPVLLVYRSNLFPDPPGTAGVWREEARAAGFPDLYLCRVESHNQSNVAPGPFGFDAAVDFEPQIRNVGRRPRNSKPWRAYRKYFHPSSARRTHAVRSYRNLAEHAANEPDVPYLRYPGVTPSWDNSPRRAANASIFHGSTPDLYGRWVRSIIDRFEPPTAEENLVFVNAWNEWAEGNHLEPDRRWGRQYLEAHKRALSQPA